MQSGAPNMANNETADAMRKMATGALEFAASGRVTLDYSQESVERLEQYMSELYEYLCSPQSTWTEKQKWGAAMTFGAYLGEVLRRTRGGEWQAGTLSNPVFVVGQVEITPAQKVMKRLTDGLEDHLGHYYRSILTCLAAADEKSGQIVIG